MHLKLDDLANVVRTTINEEKLTQAFKAEISRVLGPIVFVEGKLNEVATNANDRLDVLDRTGRTGSLDFKPSITAGWLDCSDPEVRKFASRVCPEKFLPKMKADRNPEVRAAVAARLSLPAVREMMKHFPQDDQLRTIYRQKKLHEDGIPNAKPEPIDFDMYGEKRLGDAVKQKPGRDLSDEDYHQLAMQFMHQYGGNIEYAWEELAVSRYCRSLKLSSNIEVDEKELLKAIKDMIKEKEDDAMKRNPLKETLGWLEGQEDLENLAEGAMPEVVEQIDPVTELVHGGHTGEKFLEYAMKLFRIQEAILPMSIRKWRMAEGSARQTRVPCIGMLPHKGGFRAVDERALDMFCEAWGRQQSLVGEPFRLEWTNHPSDMNKIGFTCILK